MKGHFPPGYKKRFLRLILIPPFLVCLCVCVFCVIHVYFVYNTISSSRILQIMRMESGGIRLPVSVTIFGRGSDTISARFRFSTPGGNPVGVIERSWSGWSLNLDCLVLTLPTEPFSFFEFLKWIGKRGTQDNPVDSASMLVFPLLLYSDDSGSRSAINLLPYYDLDGYPLIYMLPEISEKERASLKDVFTMVKLERIFPGLLNGFSSRRLKIRSFEPGVEYSLFLDADGYISIVR